LDFIIVFIYTLIVFGHICRMPETLVLGIVEGERQPGRPAWRWIDDVLMWFDRHQNSSDDY